MEHKQKEITINNNTFMVDIELVKTIELLNNNGWLTCGCCIEDYNKEDSAWIIIQTIDENNIVRLMQNLKGCAYQITKRMHYENSTDTLRFDYLFKTSKCNYDKRCEYINNINERLINVKQLDRDYKVNTIMSLYD